MNALSDTERLYCIQIEQSAVASSLMAQETATRVRSTSDQGRRASDQGAGRPAGSAPIHQLRVCGAELGCRPKRAEAVRLLSGSKPVTRSRVEACPCRPLRGTHPLRAVEAGALQRVPSPSKVLNLTVSASVHPNKCALAHDSAFAYSIRRRG